MINVSENNIHDYMIKTNQYHNDDELHQEI